jgi:hypothetical protein
MFVKKVFQLVKPFLANLHSTISKKYSYVYVLHDHKIFFMYRRPILCTLNGAVDFLNVLKKYIMYL